MFKNIATKKTYKTKEGVEKTDSSKTEPTVAKNAQVENDVPDFNLDDF